MAASLPAGLTDDRLFNIASEARAASRPGGRLQVDMMCRRIADELRLAGVPNAEAVATRLPMILDGEDIWSARRIAQRLRTAMDEVEGGWRQTA